MWNTKAHRAETTWTIQYLQLQVSRKSDLYIQADGIPWYRIPPNDIASHPLWQAIPAVLCKMIPSLTQTSNGIRAFSHGLIMFWYKTKNPARNIACSNPGWILEMLGENKLANKKGTVLELQLRLSLNCKVKLIQTNDFVSIYSFGHASSRETARHGGKSCSEDPELSEWKPTKSAEQWKGKRRGKWDEWMVHIRPMDRSYSWHSSYIPGNSWSGRRYGYNHQSIFQ